MASSVAASGESTRDTWTPMPRRFPSNIATFDPSRVFLIDPVMNKTLTRQSNRPYENYKIDLPDTAPTRTYSASPRPKSSVAASPVAAHVTTHRPCGTAWQSCGPRRKSPTKTPGGVNS